jgi:HSP20 family protein
MSVASIQRAPTPNALTHSLNDYMSGLYKKISERAFSLFESSGKRNGRDLEDWLKAEAEFLLPVPSDISETQSKVSVRARVSGFTEKDLEIVAEPGRLFITGKAEKRVEEKNETALYSEISANEIFRTISIPEEIDIDKVSAQLKNGVLEISIPKKAPAKKAAATAQAA